MSGTTQSIDKSSEKSLDVTIFGRKYPLMVKPEDELQVTEAIQLIKDTVGGYEKNYATKDKQDLLAMTVIHCAVKSFTGNNSVKDEELKQLNDLNQKLEMHLNS